MNYDDQDWEPPSEADMKLLAARRERSDQISKLMSGYLLKGYKMLGSVCTKCDTILLQDRQGTNYCVACSELDSDTDKDDPAINETAAMSMARELEIAAASSVLPSTGADPLLAPAAPGSAISQDAPPSGQSSASAMSNLTTTQEQSRTDLKPRVSRDDLTTNPNLSISSIDVQSFTTNVITSSVKDQTYSKYNSPASKMLTDEAVADSGFYSARVDDKRSSVGGGDASVSTSLSDSIHVARLKSRINWATQELQVSQSIEYSIHLCQLIKIASEAIVALRNARM